MSGSASRERPRNESPRSAERRYAVGMVHAFGGAILFSFPMLMTMEMWWVGFYMDPSRLALFILLDVPLLVGLSHYGGFEPTFEWKEDVLDALAACAVGFVAAAVMLLLLAIVGPGMSADEVIGKISIQAVPASIGTMLARSQLGENQRKEENRRRRYGGGLFIMAVGALYLSSSLAATEEMVLIAYKMTPVHVIALMAFSLLVMHAFVHAVVARGKSVLTDQDSFWTLFSRMTVAGYAIALLVSGFMLWIFGPNGGMPVGGVIEATIVLGFPASLGAGAARLIL